MFNKDVRWERLAFRKEAQTGVTLLSIISCDSCTKL